MSTIETTNCNILLKIKILKTAVNKLQQHNICSDNIQDLVKTITIIKDDYDMGSISILSEYFYSINKNTNLNNCHINHSNKPNYFISYQDFVRNENFMTKLDRLYGNIKNIINNESIKHKSNNKIIIGLCTLLQSYNNTYVDRNIKEIVYENCICSNKMYIEPISSTIVCKKCGLTNVLYGTVFEDDQLFFQEGQRTKHGTYDPSKHCRFWIDRIQGRENTDIPESIINCIKLRIKSDCIKNKDRLTCDQIRIYLHDTCNSKYNEHIPLIRKIITGITPPQLNEHEIQLIQIYFDKIIHIFDKIKPPTKSNCPYHPYFIYKIIEQISNHDRIRMKTILSYIHLQSRETLISNDLIWILICNEITEFTYIPTDRNELTIN